MTQRSEYRALVVEDEAALQRLIAAALRQLGFQCDTAADGYEAEKLVARENYDAVVTDLLMPNRHGHALATHLLTLACRPVIVIYTGLSEPRLAKDLLERGVDDIIFKPFHFGVLAAKVKALVERKHLAEPSTNNDSKSLENAVIESQRDAPQEQTADGLSVTHLNMDHKLASLSRLLPICTASLEVYAMTNDDRTRASQLAAAIQRDAAFAAETLRLANSSFYNASTQPVVQLDQAVMRIGHKRIGELALGMNSLAALTASLVPWMDVELVWRQSMAAGLAVEMLIDQGGHQEIEEGLLLSAIMYPLGRVALGTLYPRQYDKMIQNCQLNGDALQEQERLVFPISHTEALAHLLSTWSVPKEVRSPLSDVLKDYNALIAAPEPIRTKTELVKLATFIGRLAVGKWEPWDLVDVPPISLLNRLGVQDISDLVSQTQVDLERLTGFRASSDSSTRTPQRAPPARQLCYCDLSDLPFDFVAMMLPSMGITPVTYCEAELGGLATNVLINCIGVEPDRLSTFIERSSRTVLLTDRERFERFKGFGRPIAVPCSYNRLRSACWKAAEMTNSTNQQAGSIFAHWA